LLDSGHLPGDLAGWLQYLEQLHPKSIALGLDRINQVKDRLGLHPTFPVITVAGTNGKGSTCAMLERIYLEAGYRVGCYTSPHLLRYNERVRLSGVALGDDALCRAFEAVEHARQETPLTYFEFGTLAAMWSFIQAGIDVCVFEVGLGGRLDAVNCFEPACAIVTSVDLDHMEYLGYTRESIGLEKAGIYRPGVPAICADPAPPTTLENYAKDIGADYRRIGEHFDFIEMADGDWRFTTVDGDLAPLPFPALSGPFQRFNAASVLATIHALQSRLPVQPESIRSGLRNVRLPGRFQQVSTHPQVILDVAHNPHAAAGLAENLRLNPVQGKTVAVCGMLADKDIAGVVSWLSPLVNEWFVASLDVPRGASADVLAAQLRNTSAQTKVNVFPNVVSAFRQACLGMNENDRIIAFGSFYTVAEMMRVLPKTLGDVWQPIN
jgi:dihydrofolate synthase/folylpolyglutamate synthase